MVAISKERSVEVAIKYAKDRNLAEFTVGGAYLSENDGRSCWNVILCFVDAECDAMIGLPDSVTVHVDVLTSCPSIVPSL